MGTAFLYDKTDNGATVFMDGQLVDVPLDKVPKDIQPGADFDFTPDTPTETPTPAQDAPPAPDPAMMDDNAPTPGKAPTGAAARQQYALQKIVSLGWTPIQSAAVVGRFMQEAYPDLRTGAIGDSGMSVGVGQWNKDRRKALINFAKTGEYMGKKYGSPGRSPLDLDTQLEFWNAEIRNSPGEKLAYETLSNADSLEDASAGMMHYERPRGYKSSNPALGHGYDNTVANANSVIAAYDPSMVIALDKSQDQGSDDSLAGGGSVDLEGVIDPGDVDSGDDDSGDANIDGGINFTPPDLSSMIPDASADDQLASNGRQRIQDLLSQGQVAQTLPTGSVFGDFFGRG